MMDTIMSVIPRYAEVSELTEVSHTWDYTGCQLHILNELRSYSLGENESDDPDDGHDAQPCSPTDNRVRVQMS
jgi:hypothetical protein